MNNKDFQVRLAAVKHYFSSKDSLRATAKKFNVQFPTIFKWVKAYKQYGAVGLLPQYRRPWNRTERKLEEKIVSLFEKEPTITLREIQMILKQEGINVSLKGIWGVLKRYGYAGICRNEGNIEDHISTPEVVKNLQVAKELFRENKIKEAAEVLNKSPLLSPDYDFIVQIPDTYLNLRRYAEKSLFFQKGKIPLVNYLALAEELAKRCKSEELNFLAVQAECNKISALVLRSDWVEVLEESRKLKEILNKKKRRFSYFLSEGKVMILIFEGIAYAHLLHFQNAFQLLKKASNLLKRRIYRTPSIMMNLGAAYTHLEDYKNAEYWFLEALKIVKDKKIVMMVKFRLADILHHKGEYYKALQMVKEAKKLKVWTQPLKEFIYQAYYWLMNGEPHISISFCHNALLALRKEELFLYIGSIYATIAAAYCSIGERSKAIKLIKEVIPIIKQDIKVQNQLRMIFDLLSENMDNISWNDLEIPTIKLLYLMKAKNYKRAFEYAKRKYLISYLHQYIFFFPEVIQFMLKKGKPTGLPKAMLKLPVFNKETPIYYVKFLGDLTVYKNQKYLKVGIKPKDAAFLIHLCQQAMSPERSLNLEEVCTNLWPTSEKASQNFSHLLVRLKKALKIPTHLLEISRAYGNPILINQGVYFTTDYQEFEQTLARAKALQRAGEWSFARKEYLRAFKLFRGEPFKKNFDNWSVDMRFKILSQFETEAINFAKSCLEHGDKTDARKILQKVLKIIPDAEEAKNLLDILSTGHKKS